jgi:ubiquinone/menaquinone biosynthesis C-methylase UbiE
MRLYSNTGIILDNPTLDLGCGDGRVAHMLKELGLIQMPSCGLDISPSKLRQAKEINSHLRLLHSDANYLPFKNNTFASIICNGVLCSIPEGVEQSLKEASRVLKKNGLILATVPTDKFMEVLILPRILKRVPFKLSSIYIEKMNNRLPHFSAFSPRVWEKQFEKNGLSVKEIRTFFSRRAGFIWNLTAMHILRIFGLLKFIRNEKVVAFISNLLNKIFNEIYVKDIEGVDFGYLLIVAQKKE